MSLSFPYNSNEELLIRAQVDDIYKIEEKINLITDQLNKDKIHKNYSLKIEQLKSFRINLLQKKIKLNEVFYSEMQKITDDIQQKYTLLKNIENTITSLKNELFNFNTISFENKKLKKFILSNMGGDSTPTYFLTGEEINEIILEKNDISKNNEIIKLKRDIEINKASEKVIVNNYNEISSKIAQIQENIKMLKEEKNTTQYELINLISCKESLESIIKLNINQLNIHNNNTKEKNNEINNSNDNENNKWDKPNELFFYELQIVNSNKAAKIICNQLFNVFNINIDVEENKKIIHNKNKSNKNIVINSYNTIEDYSFINNNTNKKTINSSFNDNNNYNTINNSSYYIQKNNNINVKNNLSNISSIFNKNIIASFIKDELDKYISGEINSYKTIYEFLENLSIIIISKFQYANIIISAETLTIYLSYIFKSLYYDIIINSKIKFINKDYKNIKKNLKKLIPILTTELSKLETKFQEYKSKTEIIQKQIKLLENEKKLNYTGGVLPGMEKKLNKEEQNYIQICTKANGLNQQKKEIEKTINEYEIKKEEIKKEKDDMINKLNEEINNIDSEIVQINKKMKIEKNNLNNDINTYKQIIKEKYNIINKQLQEYKDKYGSNLDIYNRLINSINNTIKKSNSKQPLIIINNNNINNSNIYSYDQQIYRPKKVNKTLSEIDIKPNFDIYKKNKRKYNDNIFNRSNDFTDAKNKTFYSMNISHEKKKNKNKKNEDYNNINNISEIIDQRINYTNDRRYEKYNKYYNNYHNRENTNKSLNINLESNNNSNNINHKYKSFSFITSKNSKKIKNKENNFNDNIIKKKLGLFSYKKNKRIYHKINNINNNISHSHYNSTFLPKTDLNKLNNTLKDLKDIISQKNIFKNNEKILEKIKPLRKEVFCYYRYYYNNNNNKINKYNPLINISQENLYQYYDFIPAKFFIKLNDNIIINIIPINNNLEKKLNVININQININDIENTIVNSKLKLIIEVHRNFRKYKLTKFKSIEDFVEKEYIKKKVLTKEEIEKCVNNQNFNFLIAIKGGIILEIIICSYEEFKRWINGLAFLIKNKNDMK